MASYKPGNRTKAALIATAKRLFYEKGYEATSVKEICLASDVPTSAITYHFGGKEYLAQEIYEEMIGNLKEMADRATAEGSKMLVATFPYYLWWELLFYDENILRFTSEMYKYRIAQKESRYDDFTGSYGEAAKETDPEYMRMMLITSFGIETEVLLRMQAGEKFDKDKLLTYIFTTKYMSLSGEASSNDSLYKECKANFAKVKDNLEILRDSFYQ